MLNTQQHNTPHHATTPTLAQLGDATQHAPRIDRHFVELIQNERITLLPVSTDKPSTHLVPCRQFVVTTTPLSPSSHFHIDAPLPPLY